MIYEINFENQVYSRSDQSSDVNNVGQCIIRFLMQYIEKKKCMLAGVNIKRRKVTDEDVTTEYDQQLDRIHRSSYEYTLQFGTYNGTYNGTAFYIDYSKSPENATAASICYIEYIKIVFNDGVDQLFIDNLINTSQKYVLNIIDFDNDNNYVNVYIGPYWNRLSKLHKRPMDSVYIDDTQKNSIIKDIEKFYERKQFYIDNGIPYKRIYMLEGPPGTGKTSLVFALASKFNKSLSISNFGKDVDDKSFFTSLSNLSDNTFMLMEDVDCLFVQRKDNDQFKNMITFSGLLNGLDGLARKEPMIVFMTTNHIDRLDEALKRPGRMDMIVHFDYVTADQIKQMFLKLIPHQKHKLNSFIEKTSGLTLTTAMLQKFFVDNLDSIDITKEVPKLKTICEDYKMSNKDEPAGLYA